MTTSKIGKSLKATRERLGWSRETLAHRSGVSWSAISQIESGRRADVRLSSLSALARALGVSIDYLSGTATSQPPSLLEHRALLYESDDEFVDTVAAFLREGVERSEATLAVASTAGIARVRDELGDNAGSVELIDAEDWYVAPVDALRRFRGFIDDGLEAGSNWVRMVSQPVWTDRSPAEMAEWGRAESIINLTLATAPVTVVCCYDTRSAPANVVTDVRCTHPVCVEAGTSAPSPSYTDPRDFLVPPA